jgi:hypothetical protein
MPKEKVGKYRKGKCRLRNGEKGERRTANFIVGKCRKENVDTKISKKVGLGFRWV